MLPLFPLNVVVYPTEKLNLHIFEPRYRQLLGECIDQKITFGMPPYMGGQVQDYGCEVEVAQVARRYPDGRMDVSVRGKAVFRMVEFINPLPGKLYAGGQVEMLDTPDDSHVVERTKLVEAISELYDVMKLEMPYTADMEYLSYRAAHKVGLSAQQEYNLLTILSESARVEFLVEHLRKSIPVMREMEKTKELVRLNGHFRHFDPLTF